MIYADYRFYKTCFYGTTIPEQNFNAAALKASVYIDYITHGLAQENADLPAVKLCCCAIAEAAELKKEQFSAALHGVAENGGKASEKVGEYSVTFTPSEEAAEAADRTYRATAYKAALEYLAPHGLMYRGVRCV